MAPDELKDAVVGIDLGSSSTRAVIRCLDDGQYIYVEEKRNQHTGRYNAGDFSSTGYPFENVEGPCYLPNNQQPDDEDRRDMSLKYGMYVLADACHGLAPDLLQQYPLIEDIMGTLKDDKGFPARLRKGLVELFTEIRERMQTMCARAGLRITRIGLTVPVQWTLEFEDVYAQIIMEVFRQHVPKSARRHFEVDAGDIYFFTETEALAAYMFDPAHFPRFVIDDHAGKNSTFVLFLDFGGHNMNGCGMYVARSGTGEDDSAGKGARQDEVGFFTCFDSFGAGGGSEEWEFHIGKKCDAATRRTCHSELPVKSRRSALDYVNMKKRAMGPGSSQPFYLGLETVDGMRFEYLVDPETMDECWEKAHKLPLALAAEKIAGFRDFVQSDPTNCSVIVSGGSADNEALKTRLREVCQRNGLPSPIFTSDFDYKEGSSRIAHGAAYGASNCRTVEEFFAGGAAIGVQKRPGGVYGNQSDPFAAWESSSELAFVKTKSYQVLVESDGTDDFKLICEPFFTRSQLGQTDRTFSTDGCYDLIYLGQKRRGTWRFQISLRYKNDVGTLVIRASHRKHGPPSIPWTIHDIMSLPVYFANGSNTAIVGERNRTLGETLKGLGLSRSVPKNPDGSDGRAGEADEDAEDVPVDTMSEDGDELGADDAEYLPEEEEEEVWPRGSRFPQRWDGRSTAVRTSSAREKRRRGPYGP